MEIEKLFKKYHGFIKAKQLQKRNLYYHLKKLMEEGVVEKIKPGLYKHLELAQDNDMIEAAQIVENGIFCLKSACFYYNLSTDIPHTHQIAVAHKRKISLPDYPNIQLFYWTEKSLNTGIKLIKINNLNFKIYDLEKTICDMVRFRNKIDVETLNQVMRNYFFRKDKNLDVLHKYAQLFRIEKTIQDYMNLLVNP